VRYLLGFCLAVTAFFFGAMWADEVHAFDYRDGWHDGYARGVESTKPTDTDHVYADLICHFAELACPPQKANRK
jgi:hypothetical protein